MDEHQSAHCFDITQLPPLIPMKVFLANGGVFSQDVLKEHEARCKRFQEKMIKRQDQKLSCLAKDEPKSDVKFVEKQRELDECLERLRNNSEISLITLNSSPPLPDVMECKLEIEETRVVSPVTNDTITEYVLLKPSNSTETLWESEYILIQDSSPEDSADEPKESSECDDVNNASSQDIDWRNTRDPNLNAYHKFLPVDEDNVSIWNHPHSTVSNNFGVRPDSENLMSDQQNASPITMEYQEGTMPPPPPLIPFAVLRKRPLTSFLHNNGPCCSQMCIRGPRDFVPQDNLNQGPYDLSRPPPLIPFAQFVKSPDGFDIVSENHK